MILPSPHRRVLKKKLDQVRRRARTKKTDISDHLEILFVESMNVEAKTIVELGVGDGESTFVFVRVADLWGAKLVSVDIEDRRKVLSHRSRIFVQRDDVAFAADFPGWCRQRGLEPLIDILFIDTSHLYEHTVAEIAAWFPLLAPRCKVFFHDTNMSEVFVRRDGSTGQGWNNQRGVIRAIEEHLGTTFDEKINFAEFRQGWFIRHFAVCNGFMVLDRYA